MPRKPKVAGKPSKPPLAAICAAFGAGYKVRLGPNGPVREPQQFSGAYLKRAMAALGVSRNTKAADVLQWMQARGLVEQRGASYVMTSKGGHVTDRACTVMAKRNRR